MIKNVTRGSEVLKNFVSILEGVAASYIHLTNNLRPMSHYFSSLIGSAFLPPIMPGKLEACFKSNNFTCCK